MGPLVPDIIGNEFNLILAMIIGIFFGVILEQAGFSTSKKTCRAFLRIRLYGFKSIFYRWFYSNDWNYCFRSFWFN